MNTKGDTMVIQGKQVRVIVYLPDELFKLVEIKRGLIPRTALIRDLLLRYVNGDIDVIKPFNKRWEEYVIQEELRLQKEKEEEERIEWEYGPNELTLQQEQMLKEIEEDSRDVQWLEDEEKNKKE